MNLAPAPGMYDLLTHTISQGLQAFLPIAFGLPWFGRTGDADAVAGMKWGLLVALPATAAAAYGFQSSTRQALWEAALAVVACALAIWFERRVRQGARLSAAARGDAHIAHARRLAFAIATTVLVTRQTMEIAIVFGAAFQMRAFDPLFAVTVGTAASVTAAAMWPMLAGRLSNRSLHRATVTVAGLFVVQTAVYAFHESAEARLLPWSELLHAATEPYGPDGAYGRYYSALLLVMPLMAVAFTTLKTRFSFVTPETRRWIAALAPQCIACLALAAGTVGVVTELNRGVSYASESASPSGWRRTRATRSGTRPSTPATAA